MKIAQINMVHFSSTGKIMLGIAEVARQQGHEVRTFSPRLFALRVKLSYPDIPGHTYFGGPLSHLIHRTADRIFGIGGMLSVFATMKLVRQLKAFRPDVINLHNLHNGTVCLPLLLRYIRKHRIKTVWTLHDCWTMTGRCPYFTMVDCKKWRSGCHHCSQSKTAYPTRVDTSSFMWKRKKKWFAAVEDLTFVTPSAWLADLVRQSHLGIHPVEVIHNGIDLGVFHPTESNFRREHGIGDDDIMLLGVAFGWEPRKGLDVFTDLAARLDDRFKIVLVGTNDAVDKLLPENMISVHRTQNQAELAQIYSAADVFVNPTREENYPTVNMEALACGTPVVTFPTGGSPEIIDPTCGCAVCACDTDAMEAALRRIADEKPFSQAACLKRAEGFAQQLRFAEYVKLFEEK